ncbi:MAG: U32 family peptidase [Candidatus Omnitrophota bacterium]
MAIFSVPTNFDPCLIEGMAGHGVSEVYGKLQSDAVGGGRLSQLLPSLSFADLRRHADLCRQQGMAFNYLLNASASDNMEYTRSGQRALAGLVDRLWAMGITRFTVATPYLLRFLKSRYPGAWVKISVFAQVGDARKARQWEDMGADEVVLDSLLVNREFHILEDIRRSVKIPLQLLVNNNCDYGCSLSPYHMNVLASGSRRGSKTQGILPDYCYLHCTAQKLREPERFLMADWIRPEDLAHYERLGYDNFKLSGRNLPTEVLLRRLKAYHGRHYEGNLLDLIQDFGHTVKPDRSLNALGNRAGSVLTWLRHSAPLRIGAIRRLLNLSRKRGFISVPEVEPPVTIDNRALDGFLEPILGMNGCRNRVCGDCQYCHGIAKKAITVRDASRQLILKDQEVLVKEMESGAFWR